jgi:membrane protein
LSSTTTDPGSQVGTPPKGPGGLTTRDWRDALVRSAKEFMADDCMALSQQIAFSSLLAFLPALVVLIGVLGLFGAFDDLQEFLGTIAPGAVLDAIDLAEENAKGSGGSAAAVILGTALAVWAASGATSSVIKAVNRAYDQQETRPFWKVRVIALVLVVLTGLVTTGVFLLIVFGGPLGEAIADQAGLGGAFELLWTIARWPLAFVAILLFFALAYYLAPDTRQRNWRWVSPGSVVGSIAWLALSGLFALYTSYAGSYSETYGSLAGGIVLLLWLNYSAWALLYGAELNAELDRQAAIRAAGGPSAGLVEPSRRIR